MTAYDALTLQLERADMLTSHLVDRLSDLSDGSCDELYALSIIAEDIRAKHALIREGARALYAKGR